MEKFFKILDTALMLSASDIHLLNGKSPVFRVEKKLIEGKGIEPLTKYDLEGLMEYIVDNSLELVDIFENSKRLDISYEYMGKRFRVNASMAFGVPTFSIRIIENEEGKRRLIKMTSDDVIAIVREYQRHVKIRTGYDEIRSQLYEDMLKLFIGGSNFMNAAMTIQTNNNSFPSTFAFTFISSP